MIIYKRRAPTVAKATFLGLGLSRTDRFGDKSQRRDATADRSAPWWWWWWL